MKSLLRSVFRVQPSESEKEANANFSYLLVSGLNFDLEEDQKIWEFVKSFYQTQGHVPQVTSIRSHFERGRDPSIVDRLEQSIVQEKVKTRGDFLAHLEHVVEDKKVKTIINLSKELVQIVRTGLEIQEGREKISLHNSSDAIRYFMDKSSGLLTPVTGGRLSGNVMKDGSIFKERYNRVKMDPSFGVGQYCGLKQIDDCFRGAQKKKLWLHAAWPGHLKSSFALHWAYVQSVYFGYPSLYFSLEMPYEEQVLNYLYTMHSAHEDFAGARKTLGIEGLGLDYDKIKYAELNKNEEEFLFKFVVPDLNKEATVPHDGPFSLHPKDYGDLLIDCYDPDKSDFTVADLRAKAEVLYQQVPFHMIFVDHVLLMEARRKYSNTTDKLNEIVKDLKRLAMSFNHGAGMAVLGLWQISRQGYDYALRNEGRYNMTCLNYSNECMIRATSVLTDSGIVPVEKIESGARVWSRSGWKQVFHRFDQGKKQIWKIETDRGSVLEVTEKHRIRVLEDEEIQWKYVKDLQSKDWVISTKGDYPWAADIPTLPDSQCYSKLLTEDLAYLLGAWDGDGRIRPNKIGFTGNRKEKDIKKKLIDTYKTVFEEDIFCYEFKSRKGSFDLESKANKERTSWFENLAGLRGKEIPKIIFTSPKRYVLAYLRGLFDTDGWINCCNTVGLKMKSKKFLSQVQLLLTHLGYDSTLKQTEDTLEATGKTYKNWMLRLLGYDCRVQFSKEIGFLEGWKQERLLISVEKPPKRKKTNQAYPIQKLFISLYEQYKPYRFTQDQKVKNRCYTAISKARKGFTVSQQSAELLLDILDSQNISDSKLEEIRHILSLQVIQIKSVKKTNRFEDVFDLEIDGDHEYQTGPLLSHNCEKSADVITAGWFGDEVRLINRVLFQCLKSRDEKPFDRFAARVEPECRRILTDLSSMDQVEQEIEVAVGRDAVIPRAVYNGGQPDIDI